MHCLSYGDTYLLGFAISIKSVITNLNKKDPQTKRFESLETYINALRTEVHDELL